VGHGLPEASSASTGSGDRSGGRRVPAAAAGALDASWLLVFVALGLAGVATAVRATRREEDTFAAEQVDPAEPAE